MKKNYKKAAELFEKSAEQGYAEAQHWLGHCYHMGVGVKEDGEKAYYWWTKAAEQGNDGGYFGLYCCYKQGSGVKEDLKKALYWLEKAVEAGHRIAKISLPHLLKEIEAIETGIDNEPPDELYGKADKGDAEAQFELANFYMEHDEFDEAMRWYEEAADWGNKDAIAKLNEINKTEPYGLDSPTAKEMIRHCLSLKIDDVIWNNFVVTALQGDTDSQRLVGTAYYHGEEVQEGVPQDHNRALFWIKLSAEQGNEKAQEMLNQIDAQTAPEKAQPQYSDEFQALLKRAEEGTQEGNDLDAQYTVGLRYLKGSGVEQNVEQGLYWLKIAAWSNHAPSCDLLIHLYENGDYVPKDPVTVEEYRQRRKNAEVYNLMSEYRICGCGRKIYRTGSNYSFPQMCSICIEESNYGICSRCGARVSKYSMYCTCGAKFY